MIMKKLIVKWVNSMLVSLNTDLILLCLLVRVCHVLSKEK